MKKPDKNRKSVQKPVKNGKRRGKLSLTARAWIYPVLLVVTLIFAQTLKQPVSHMIFVFVLLMPIGIALQFIAAVLSIRVSVRCGAETAEKNTPVSYRFITSNDGPVPFPFIEALLTVPDERGARCTEESVGLSLAPLSGCEVEREAEFAFRGVYEIGLSDMWVYDFFRMARIRLDNRFVTRLFVMPRRFELPPQSGFSDSENVTDTSVTRTGNDDTEPTDLRAYVKGDSLKHIHWKLSSKSEDMIVKDFAHSNGDRVYIICDLGTRYENCRKLAEEAKKQPDKPSPEPLLTPLAGYDDIMDQLNSDLVVENALAAAKRELRAGNTVSLVWLEERGGEPCPRTALMTGAADFENAFRVFATAPLTRFDGQIKMLASLIPDIDSSNVIMVTSCLGTSDADDFMTVASGQHGGGGSSELILCVDESLYVTDDEAAENVADRAARISAVMRLTPGRSAAKKRDRAGSIAEDTAVKEPRRTGAAS